MLKFFKKYGPAITYCLAVIVIIFPLLGPGHVFAIDQVFQEWISKPVPGENIYLWRWLQYAWQFFLPVWIFEKLVFVAFFALLITGAERWLRLFTDKRWWRLFGVLALVFSPLVYDRFVDGSTNVYLSCALYPWLLAAAWKFFKSWSWPDLAELLLWIWLLLGTSIYNILVIGAVLAVIFAIRLTAAKFSSQPGWHWRLLALVILIAVTNLYWLWPTWQQANDQGQLVFSNIRTEDYQLYKPVAIGPLPAAVAVLLGTGYWGAAMGRYRDLFEGGAWLWTAAAALFSLIALLGLALGSIGIRSRERRLYAASGLLALVAYFLALGLSSPFTRGVTAWLFENLKVYGGFRETTKWQGLLLVALVPGLVGGARFIWQILAKRFWRWLWLLLLAAALSLNAWPLLFGAQGQLRSQAYPAGWEEARVSLASDPSLMADDYGCAAYLAGRAQRCYKILILPWHKYFFYNNSLKKKSYDILEGYFGNQALGGDNVEIGNIYSQSGRPESQTIERYVNPQGYWRYASNWHEAEFVSDLQSLGIKVIVMAKEVDYRGYQPVLEKLLAEGRLSLRLDNANLQVYNLEP